MKWARGGYTVIEVLIVVAITSAMLISAVTIFNGKQAESNFNQAMYDLESRINLIVNDVGRSVFPADRYDCVTSSDNRPQLVDVGTRVEGSSQDCIFLGKAVEARAGEENVIIHTVLGNRTYQAGAVRVPVTEFSQTRPTPATDNNNAPVLTEQFSLGSGDARIVWACSSDASACPPPNGQQHELVGFYNSLQPTSVPELQGSQALDTRTYRIISSSTDACIKEEPSCQIVRNASGWKLCLKSNNGKNTALLTINSSPAGVTTQLQLKPDPAVCS